MSDQPDSVQATPVPPPEIGGTAASPCSTILDKVAKTLQNYRSGISVQ